MDVPVVSKERSRHHHGGDKPHRHKSEKKHRSSKKKVHTDTIDKLDVTGFFGPGSFHHDGPFDACNPNRNKVKNKGPMSAFPVNSANNQLGGKDPNKDKYATENRILCRDVDEAYLDYSRKGNNGTPAKGNGASSSQAAFNPSAKTDPVHGDLTWGLGSSTFLDGAPASKTTISQSQADQGAGAGGLGRKKSLVQRLRGGNGPAPTPPPREHQRRIHTDHSDPTTRHTSLDDEPAANFAPRKGSDPAADPSPPATNGLLRRVKSLKVGSRRRAPS
jgi:hypothetical protein